MAANTLEYAVLYQTRLDEQVRQELTTKWMEGNAGQVKYEGGNTVKVPKRTVNGLGNYSKTLGYPTAGAVTLSFETFILTQDRAQAFHLDSRDIDETNFLVEAGAVLKQFQTDNVIPEVDSYRYSKIYALANAVASKTGPYTPAVGTIYSQLKADILKIQKVIGNTANLVIMMNFTASDMLSRSTEITKTIAVDQSFVNGDIETKVKKIDGIPIVEVSDDRMKTAYTFSATAGYTVSALGNQINWIIMARSAPLAITKLEKPKILAPEQLESGDWWFVGYRRFHDLWIFDRAFDGIYVSYTAASAAPALAITITKPVTLGKTSWAPDVALGTGETLAVKMSDTAGTDLYNDIPTGTTAYTAAAEIAATATKHMLCYQLDALGHIVKYVDHTLVAGDIGTGA